MYTVYISLCYEIMYVNIENIGLWYDSCRFCGWELMHTMGQGIICIGGRGWYCMCSHQPTVGLVVLTVKQNIFFAQTATYIVD
jgi:hypothetical protein